MSGHTVSLTGSLTVENLIPAKMSEPGTALTATTTWRADAFYDPNNSLLASVMLCGIADRRLKVNIYPGLLKLGSFKSSFFLSGTREWVVGMNVGCWPLGAAQGMGSGSLSL